MVLSLFPEFGISIQSGDLGRSAERRPQVVYRRVRDQPGNHPSIHDLQWSLRQCPEPVEGMLS